MFKRSVVLALGLVLAGVVAVSGPQLGLEPGMDPNGLQLALEAGMDPNGLC